ESGNPVAFRSRDPRRWVPAFAGMTMCSSARFLPAPSICAPPPRYTPRMTKFAAWLLYLLAAAIGRLPWAWLRRLGAGMAWAWRRSGARESEVAMRNLELAYPE